MLPELARPFSSAWFLPLVSKAGLVTEVSRVAACGVSGRRATPRGLSAMAGGCEVAWQEGGRRVARCAQRERGLKTLASGWQRRGYSTGRNRMGLRRLGLLL